MLELNIVAIAHRHGQRVGLRQHLGHPLAVAKWLRLPVVDRIPEPLAVWIGNRLRLLFRIALRERVLVGVLQWQRKRLSEWVADIVAERLRDRLALTVRHVDGHAVAQRDALPELLSVLDRNDDWERKRVRLCKHFCDSVAEFLCDAVRVAVSECVGFALANCNGERHADAYSMLERVCVRVRDDLAVTLCHSEPVAEWLRECERLFERVSHGVAECLRLNDAVSERERVRYADANCVILRKLDSVGMRDALRVAERKRKCVRLCERLHHVISERLRLCIAVALQQRIVLANIDAVDLRHDVAVALLKRIPIVLRDIIADALGNGQPLH
jgi:hypothetical protein